MNPDPESSRLIALLVATRPVVFVDFGGVLGVEGDVYPEHVDHLNLLCKLTDAVVVFATMLRSGSNTAVLAKRLEDVGFRGACVDQLPLTYQPAADVETWLAKYGVTRYLVADDQDHGYSTAHHLRPVRYLSHADAIRGAKMIWAMA